MGWPTRINKILKFAGMGAGVANALGLPVPNVLAVVQAIHDSPTADNTDADAILAAQVDALAERVKGLEATVESLKKLIQGGKTIGK
jgi:hypothetical protein